MICFAAIVEIHCQRARSSVQAAGTVVSVAATPETTESTASSHTTCYASSQNGDIESTDLVGFSGRYNSPEIAAVFCIGH